MLRLTGPSSSRGESAFAVRFIVVSAVVYAAAGSLAAVLLRFGQTIFSTQWRVIPPAFFASTLLLAAGSALLIRANYYVRREKQTPFRRCLIAALVAGTLFVAVQSFGLALLLNRQNPADVATGVNAFVFVFVALHGLHFALALWFLIFVTLRAFADAYDHEYSWGITVCGWFWHALAAAWTAILAVFVITA